MARVKKRGLRAGGPAPKRSAARDPGLASEFCPNCTQSVSQLDRFCPGCGTMLPGGEEE